MNKERHGVKKRRKVKWEGKGGTAEMGSDVAAEVRMASLAVAEALAGRTVCRGGRVSRRSKPERAAREAEAGEKRMEAKVGGGRERRFDEAAEADSAPSYARRTPENS